MTVLDLILQLQKCPQDMQVMVDVTKENSDVFHFLKIYNAEEIEAGTGEKFVMLETHPLEEPNFN